MKFCVDTRTQYMSANVTLPPQQHFLSAQYVHVDTVIVDAILRKGTRDSFRLSERYAGLIPIVGMAIILE